MVGVAWVLFLAIPLKGRPIFHHLYNGLVPIGLVNAIGGQAEMAWYKAKAMARSALSDADEERERRF